MDYLFTYHLADCFNLVNHVKYFAHSLSINVFGSVVVYIKHIIDETSFFFIEVFRQIIVLQNIG